jgi:cobalt/nickel transport system permease protein
VLPGTSGHLIGAALAVALVGPWLAVLSLALVLTIQSVVFADGGLTALGTNVLLMALVGVGVAAAVNALVQRSSTGRDRPRLGAALGAAASVPISAAVLAALIGIGGTSSAPFGDVLGSMIGIHALIGLGEAVITVAVLAAVMALAPGLAVADSRPLQHDRRRSGTGVLAAAGVSAVLLTSVASTDPDGLEAVSTTYSLDALTSAHLWGSSLLAEYGAVNGVPVALAGIAGLLLTAAATWSILQFLGRTPTSPGLARA